MFVSALLLKVDVRRIAYYQLVASVAGVGSAGVHLVAVADVDAVETSAYKGGNRIGGAVADSGIENFLLVAIDQPRGYIGPIGVAVVACEHGCRYR